MLILHIISQTLNTMGKRSTKDWENKFKCVKAFMSVMDTFDSDDDKLIECCSVMLRNPVIFDNNLKEVKTYIPYHIEGVTAETEDHLIGMSNMVLYIFKNGLHNKWETVNDFKSTLKSLNVLLPVTKFMNDSSDFKGGWQFKSDNINDCIKWNNKLKSIGVTELVCNTTGEKKDVDVVWDEWYNQFVTNQ